LFVVLYPRGASSSTSSFRDVYSCDSYHWTLTVGPQTPVRTEAGTRYHVAHLDHDYSSHFYEEQDISASPVAQTGLIRVAVCKVRDEERLQFILRNIRVPEDDTAFNCLTWVREAFCQIHDDGKSVKTYLNSDDWINVETCARKFCKRKRDAGRFQEDANINGGAVDWDVRKISTFNFWENRQTTA